MIIIYSVGVFDRSQNKISALYDSASIPLPGALDNPPIFHLLFCVEMKSRQALSCARLLYRELTSETTIGSKQLIRGLSSAVTTTQTTIQLPPSRFQGTSVVLPFAARSQSTDSSAVWNTILYPDSELEIGAPAPDFSAPAVVDNEITDVKMSVSFFFLINK